MKKKLTATERAKATIVTAEKQLAKAKEKLKKLRGNKTIKCNCGKSHKICDLELVLVLHYDSNTGSPNGGFWCCDEWAYVCSETTTYVRMLFDDYGIDWQKRQDPKFAAKPAFMNLYRYCWKSSKEVKSDDLYPFNNNYYIDEHRVKFELPEKRKST